MRQKASYVLVQLPTATECCSSKCKAQLDEFLINIIRRITVSMSLLVFPMEFPRKRGALGFHASVLSPSGSHPPTSTGQSPHSTPFPRLWGKSSHPICFSWGWCSSLCLCAPSPATCPRRGKPRAVSEVHAVTRVKSQAFRQFRKP